MRKSRKPDSGICHKEYDAPGNVTKLTLDDNLGAGKTGDATVTYEYDDLYRLTKEYCDPAVGSYRTEYGYQYTYDDAGNRQQTDVYDPASTSWNTVADCTFSARNVTGKWGRYPISLPSGGALEASSHCAALGKPVEIGRLLGPKSVGRPGKKIGR